MLNEVLILLFFSVLGVAIFQRLNFPSVLGYLVVGMLAGEHALGLIQNSHAIEQIAEIGVVFLLFTRLGKNPKRLVQVNISSDLIFLVVGQQEQNLGSKTIQFVNLPIYRHHR